MPEHSLPSIIDLVAVCFGITSSFLLPIQGFHKEDFLWPRPHALLRLA